MKKFFYLILFICVAIAMYQNNSTLKVRQEDHLTIWVSEDEFEILTQMNAQFEQQYGIKLKMKIMTSEQVLSNLPLYIDKSDYPDIITVSHTLISELVKMDALSPVNDIFETLNILPTVKSGFKLKGQYYGVPYNAETDILFYNKIDFPEGLSSFNKLEDYPQMKLVLDYQDINQVTPFITAFGGYTIGIDNFGDTNFYDIGLNQEESILGLSTMLQLLDKNLFYNNEGELYQSFINQEANLMIGSSRLMDSLKNEFPELGYQAIPNFIGDVVPQTYMKIDTYQLTKYSENKELAKHYLEFLLSIDVATARYNYNRSIAPIDYEFPISHDQYYQVVKKQLHRSLPLPNCSEFNYLYLPYKEAAQKFIRMPDQLNTILDETVHQINQYIEVNLNK